jgi:hypothetical protein
VPPVSFTKRILLPECHPQLTQNVVILSGAKDLRILSEVEISFKVNVLLDQLYKVLLMA